MLNLISAISNGNGTGSIFKCGKVKDVSLRRLFWICYISLKVIMSVFMREKEGLVNKKEVKIYVDQNDVATNKTI